MKVSQKSIDKLKMLFKIKEIYAEKNKQNVSLLLISSLKA